MASAPYSISEPEATQVLEQYRGNLNNAVDALLRRHDENQSQEASSFQSSSVERDLGSDEDYGTTPKKKQDRRLSRASKSAQRRHRERKHEEIRTMLTKSNESLESLANVNAAPVRRRNHRVIEDSDDESASPPPALNDGSTTPDSEYSSSTDYSSQSQVESTLPATLKIPAANMLPTKPTTNRPPSRPLSTPADAIARFSKPNGINKSQQKRLLSSRDRKDLQKQAQKAQAKERRRQAANQVSSQPTSATSSFGGTQQSAAPVMSHFRVLHI